MRSDQGDMDLTEGQVDKEIAYYKAQLEESGAAKSKRAIRDFVVIPGAKWDSAIKYSISDLKSRLEFLAYYSCCTIC